MALIATPKNGFFDEAGTHDGSDLVVVGGLVSSYEAWTRAELEWKQILKSKGINIPLHFTDFMARQQPWNWPTPERDDFMERLTTTIGDNVTVGIAYGIFREDYDEISASLRAEFKDIYHALSYFCLEALAKWDRTFESGPALPKPIEFLFDRKPKFEGYAASIYYEVVKQVAVDGALGEIGFGSKDNDIPLQMADTLVGSAVRHFRRQKKSGLNVAPERSIAKMNKNNRLILLWLRKEDLRMLMEKMKAAQQAK